MVVEYIERLKRLPLGNICDANGKGGNMDAGMKPIDPGSKLIGPAYTVKCHPGDNLAIHLAIVEAPEGSVLVVDAGGYIGGGHFGEIMATACMARGIAGLVIDGAVRDAGDMQELGFPVFARGLNPDGTVKGARGTLGAPIVCGGICVRSGDCIVGDRDGVVVIEKEKLGDVVEKAEAIAKREVYMLQQLKEGKTTLELLDLDGRQANA